VQLVFPSKFLIPDTIYRHDDPLMTSRTFFMEAEGRSLIHHLYEHSCDSRFRSIYYPIRFEYKSIPGADAIKKFTPILGIPYLGV